MFRSVSRLLAGAVLAAAGIPAAPSRAAPPPAYADPVEAGEMKWPPRQETSGLAASRRDPGVLWTHDDSGGKSSLFAITTQGARVGELNLRGVKNEDWEDLAAFELDGKAWLLVADTGDNDHRRPTVQLHLVEEPPLDRLREAGELHVRPARTLQVRYEDGAHDCESVAVDAATRRVYLLTKRDPVPLLFRVELEPKDGNAIVIARRVGTVGQLPTPSGMQLRGKGFLGRLRGAPTAMDFRSDGSAALVLTYGGLLLFPREPNEPWETALARVPLPLPPHPLLQTEAACFSPDGRRIYVAAENDRTLFRYDQR